MEIEYEAKFYPVNKTIFRKKLKELNAKLLLPERKMKRILIDGAKHPHLKCDYIRIRDEGNLVRLSAKIHADKSGKLADQKEVDIIVSDYDRTKEIIEAMGLTFDIYQETLRETWMLDGAEIEIDTWPGLKTYCEIEAKSEAEVKEVATKLGLNWSEKIVTSVKPIYSKVYGLDLDTVTKHISYITFENNPFSKLKKV